MGCNDIVVSPLFRGEISAPSRAREETFPYGVNRRSEKVSVGALYYST